MVGVRSWFVCVLLVRSLFAVPERHLPTIDARQATPENLSQLSQSTLASLTSLFTLWNVKAHCKSIRDGFNDLWHFRTHARSYVQAQEKLKKFEMHVMRKEVSYREPLDPVGPSLLQKIEPSQEGWIRAVESLNAYLDPKSENLRSEFERFMRIEVASSDPLNAGQHLELLAGWERTGNLDLLHTWALQQLQEGVFAGPAGASLFQKYIQFTHRLGMLDWQEHQSMEILQSWYLNLVIKTPGELGYVAHYTSWYKGLEDLLQREVLAFEGFLKAYPNLVFGLQAFYPKAFHPIENNPTRKVGHFLESQPSGVISRPASELRVYVQDACANVLKELETACADAKAKGTCTGAAKNALQKILLPTAMIATGVTTTWVAIRGFYKVLLTVIGS